MVTDMSLHMEDVRVMRRRKTILGPLSLDLPADGFTIVLGPNGSGKTTLLKVMHGVERVSSGRIVWSVQNEVAQQAQAYVFQTPVMLRRTVAQNLAYPLQLQRVSRAEIEDRVETWARRIGLADALDRPAPRLSGGEKQKLALGRALIRDPRVLFLDEPCASLDGRATREIESLLLEAHGQGTRIIMSTHDLGQARRLASDVIFLLNGHVLEQAKASDFFDRPATSEAGSFIKGDIVE